MFEAPAASAAGPCAGCHAEQAGRHGRSAHGNAIRPVEESLFFRNLPQGPIGEARNGYLLHYERAGDGLLVTAARGADAVSGRIRWVFGAGNLAETPIVELDGSWIEHRLSYYRAAAKFDLTLGHGPGASANARAALGIPQPEAVFRQCVGCHATAGKGTTAIASGGVACERCHPGASAHAEGGRPPVNPAKMEARASVALCAACHRLQPPSGNARDPLNIRFQPYRLVRSRCYRSGKLSCVRCHEGHGDAKRDVGHYRQVCISCHQQPHQSGDCIACHMPRSMPAPYLAFTDHFIR